MTLRRNKFNNKKTELNGITFDSKKEAARYYYLSMMQRAGNITNLELQPKIPLMVNGKKLGHYIGDFRYIENGEVILEDVKSVATKTAVYNLKKKILASYDPPILIREIM